MSKKIKLKAIGRAQNDESDAITSQFRHIKELSKLKYDAEERREQNLIQQSSQMQTVFSFMTAAIFMAAPICIEYRGTLSLEFFLLSISIVVIFLTASLVLASIAQWRWKTKALPDIATIKDEVINTPNWETLTIEYNQIDQWVNIIGEVQSEKAKLNDRRVKLIMASMICFYCSISSIVISFVIGISKIV